MTLSKVNYRRLVVVLLMIILGCDRTLDNKLSTKEIISAGHRYIVFGSQRTGGIELFDFRDAQFHSLISTPDINIRQYMMPVVAANGKGFCIKQEHTFNAEKKTNEIIAFDLNTLENKSTGIKIKMSYANLAISHDSNKLAFVFKQYSNDKPSLGILNINKNKISRIISVDERFAEYPVKTIWKPDGQTVVIWDTITDQPAIEINTTNNRTKLIAEYPLDFKNDLALFMDRASKSYYLLEPQNKKQTSVDINHVTAHSFKISRDGKFLLYGWLKGKGFETLVIRKIGTDREYQIALDNHPSTVLGLDIW